MLDDEQIKQKLKMMSTHLHEQISALKVDVQRAIGESSTAVDISATLEKVVHELESKKDVTDQSFEAIDEFFKLVLPKMNKVVLDVRKNSLSIAMNHLCIRLYVLGIIGTIIAGGDELKQVMYGERLLDLLQSHEDLLHQISDATKAEQLYPIGVRFIDRYIEIQSQILK